MINREAYKRLAQACAEKQVTLVAVSKTKPVEDILALYDLGQRDFGENYVQELVEKEKQLPKDIRWHFIGHLQSNKAKLLVGFVHLVHGVDSLKLLKEIDKQSAKLNIVTHCLLQVHIAQETTKFGLNENELADLLLLLQKEPIQHVQVDGLMGMASFTDDAQQLRYEFRQLVTLRQKFGRPGFPLSTLSMGMTADHTIAIEEGSTMVRIGSMIFGER